jgi:hypothetical protein
MRDLLAFVLFLLAVAILMSGTGGDLYSFREFVCSNVKCVEPRS